MKNKVIAFITSHTTHTHQRKEEKIHSKHRQKKHSHSRCKCVCKTRSKTTTKQNRQPELHQLTTKQTKILSNRKEKQTLKNGKKQQRLSKLCFNQQKQKS